MFYFLKNISKTYTSKIKLANKQINNKNKAATTTKKP